ncbi:MAG: hypothetical protein FJ293_08360 [Planctomycetes bacterium]|nr:hypothetical protein [Planctomycetota bacterium]
MNLRASWMRWPLRLAFALGSSEAALWLASGLLERGVTGNDFASVGAGPILCVGDSNTFGVGADPGRAYPDQLQQLLREAGDARSVVNLGFPGLTSRAVVDRLEAALSETRPSTVLFLAGMNDRGHGLAALDVRPARSEPPPPLIDQWLDGLRTWRMLRTAWRAATGDVAREEFGGVALAATPPRPPPSRVPIEEWESEYQRARAEGPVAAGEWVEWFWHIEDPVRARSAFEELLAPEQAARIEPLLRAPRSLLEWELRGMEDGRRGPLPQGALEGLREAQLHDAFIKVARFIAAWEAAPSAAIASEFEAVAPRKVDPWGTPYLRLHQGYAAMLRRDWKAAEERLIEATQLGTAVSPTVGVAWSRGGAALAAVLGGGDPRDAEGKPIPTEWLRATEKAWNGTYYWRDLPLGREWMAAAEIVEARRYGPDSAQHATAVRRARARCPEPRTAPLRWLLDHPEAGFAQIVAELPIEPARCAWWSIRHFLFRNLERETFDRVTAESDARLAALAKQHGFPVVILTYLSQDAPMFNDRLRRLAQKNRWPIADVHAAHARAEIEADDRGRYFSADRGHPNGDGYALIARKAFATLMAPAGQAGDRR